MVDNVAITPGSGATVAADEIAGVLYQRVKQTWGPDGTANDTDVATGKPLPIQVRSATGLVPIGEPTDAKNTATDTTSVSAISILKQISASVQAMILSAGAAVIGKVDHTTTGIGHGVTTVTTAGTDVALAGSTVAKWVTIQAQTDNTARVAVGATGVDATIATGNGISLAAGDSITLPCDNLADIFVDSLVNGEGVRYVYGT